MNFRFKTKQSESDTLGSNRLLLMFGKSNVSFRNKFINLWGLRQKESVNKTVLCLIDHDSVPAKTELIILLVVKSTLSNLLKSIKGIIINIKDVTKRNIKLYDGLFFLNNACNYNHRCRIRNQKEYRSVRLWDRANHKVYDKPLKQLQHLFVRKISQKFHIK